MSDTKKKVLIQVGLDDKASAALHKFGTGAEGVASGLKKSFKAVSVAVATVTASVTAGTYAFVKMSERVGKIEGLSLGFERNFGNMENSLNSFRKASQGMVSDMDLMQTANRAALLGVTTDVGKLSGLMVTARLRGREMGMSMTDAFNDIVTGIGRSSPLILDNLGIKIPDALTEAMKSMSEAKKMQTLLNFAIKDGAKIASQYGDVIQLTAGEKTAILKATFVNIKDNILNSFIPALSSLVYDGLAPVLNMIQKLTSEDGLKGMLELLKTGESKILDNLGIKIPDILNNTIKKFLALKEVIEVVFKLLSGEDIDTDTLLRIFPEGTSGEKWLDVILQVRDAFEEIATYLESTRSALSDILPSSEDISKVWGEFVGWLKDFFSPENVSLAIEKLRGGLVTLLEWVDKVWKALVEFWEKTLEPLLMFWWDMIKTYIIPELEKLKGKLKELFTRFGDDGKWARELLRNIATIIGIVIVGAITVLIGALGLVTKVVGFLIDILILLKKRSTEVWDNMIDRLAKIINLFRDIVWWVQKTTDKIKAIPNVIGIDFKGNDKRATGGVTTGGWTMVGERGAELVSLPRGSHVYNSEDTKQMVGNNGITINVNAPVTGVDNLKAVILEAVNEATERQNRLANYNLL